MKNIGIFKDFNDSSIKSVYEIRENNIIEMTLLQNKEYEDIICVPTHYFCDLGCKMCNLPSKNSLLIKTNEFITALIDSLRVQNTDKKRTDKKKLVIKFNGIGEPLLNLKLIEEVFKYEDIIKDSLDYDYISYELNTMVTDVNLLKELEKSVLDNNVLLKINFNLLACNDELRKKLLPKAVSSIDDILGKLEEYQNKYGYNSVNVLYSFINGINNSDFDLNDMVKLLKKYNLPIKFVSNDEEKEVDWIQELYKNNCKSEIIIESGKSIGINYTKYFYNRDKMTQDEKESFDKWKNIHQIFESQRRDNLSWDEYFMCVAKLTAMRSKDPSTQVGAVIVGKDNRILSIGYNGSPNGYNDERFPWKREGNKLYTKYLFVVHAERNAILNYLGNRNDFQGARIYVDLFPCNECAKEIIQSGIKEVVYLSDKYKDTEETIASKRLFDVCGVKYRHFSTDREITLKLNK